MKRLWLRLPWGDGCGPDSARGVRPLICPTLRPSAAFAGALLALETAAIAQMEWAFFDAYRDFCVESPSGFGYGYCPSADYGYAAYPGGPLTLMPAGGLTASNAAGLRVEWIGVPRPADPTIFRNTNNVILVVPSNPSRFFPPRTLTIYSGTAGQPDAYAVIQFPLYTGYYWPSNGQGRLETRVQKVGSGDVDVRMLVEGAEVASTNLTSGSASWTNFIRLSGFSDQLRWAIGPGADGLSGAGVRLEATLTLAEPPHVGASAVSPSTVRLGSNAIFYVYRPLGSEPFWYQWYHEHAAAPGATNGTFTLTNAQLADAGGYSVVVTNVYGAATSSVVTLTVDASPLIIRQPEPVIAQAGEIATFRVAVQGLDPLAFQWRRDGVALPGTDAATLNLPVTGPGDAGLYSVVVTNVFGAVTSAPARLYTGTNLLACDEASISNALVQGGYSQFICDGTVVLPGLVVRVPVILDAAGHRVTLSGGGSNVLFQVLKDGSLTLLNLALEDGRGGFGGGAIRNEGGSVVAYGCSFLNNRTENFGGAIAVFRGSRFTATDCVFSNNHAVGAFGFGGGAIYHEGDTLALTNCLFVRNTAAATSPYTSAGGSLYQYDGNAFVVGCVFREGQAGNAGGILARGQGQLTVLRSQFLCNVAQSAGGAIVARETNSLFLRDCLLASNAVVGDVNQNLGRADGGALAVWSSAEVSGTQFIGNSAHGGLGQTAGVARGGAIFNGGPLFLVDCVLLGNTVAGGAGATAGWGGGGAIGSAGRFRLSRCLLASNLAVGGEGRFNGVPTGSGGQGLGGALFVHGGPGLTSVTNCTFAANRARGGRGESPTASGPGVGGAIYMDPLNPLIAAFCTFADNGAFYDGDTPGSGAATLHVASGSLSLFGSILAASAGGLHSTGEVINLGFNVSSDGTPDFQNRSNSFNNVDPKLGPLADNGGSTLTMALLPGSPALDAIAAVNTTATTDQRNMARPAGSGADIGAFELGPAAAPRLLIARAEGAVDIRCGGEAGRVYHLLSSIDLRQWRAIATNRADANGPVRFAVTAGGGSQAFYRVMTP